MLKKIVIAASAVFVLAAGPAIADDDDDDRRHSRWYEHQGDREHSDKHHRKHHRQLKKVEKHVYHHGRGHKHKHRKAKKKVYVEKHVYHHRPKKYRHAKRHHDHGYRRHGHHGKHAYKRRQDDRDWAIFAILALQIVDVLNESQQHSYATAQRRAASAPLGEAIRWNDGSASGRVVPLREGNDSGGRYCREFQQEVVVGNQRQAGYGIACRQPDGAWEIAS